ncbi:MAG: VanW family protein [Actinomycetia bacterium]|nr:VanW family protein [Actinomycetes bacterium]
MAIPKSRLLALIAVPALILLLPLTVYFVDSAAASDKVARNVSIAGIDVARYTEEEAASAIETYTTGILENTVTVEVNGQTFTLDPAEVELTFDTSGAVEDAMSQYKAGISDWFTSFSDGIDVPVNSTINENLLLDKFLEWELAAIPNPAFEGSIEIANQNAVILDPKEGEALDRASAVPLVGAALRSGSSTTIVLATEIATPVHTSEDLAIAAEAAEDIVDQGVILTNDEYGFSFEVDSFTMGAALEIDVTTDGTDTIVFSLDRAGIQPLIKSATPSLEIPPTDAWWKTVVVDDTEDWDENYAIPDAERERVPGEGGLPTNDSITLMPSLLGTSVDADQVFAEVEKAALVGGGQGPLPLDLDAEPGLTTDDAAKYGDLYEVAEFTTRMPGTNRAFNIALMAELIDDTVVWPGDTFSVNDFVGIRTIDKGFKYDCAIVSGELSCEEDPVNVGGGVSQFGTTIFNAIYFGCYEDVIHQPHSIYFSKYPEGREATLGFPSPDVAFRNDSDAPVIIRATNTKHSLTVTFFGNQEGMTCGTERSERSNVTSAVKEYQVDPDGRVAPGSERVKSRGSKGWTVTNTRIFYDAAGNELKREHFPWRYRGEKNVILVHACDTRAGGNGNCPVVVPGVSGLASADATATLAAAGFTVVVVESETSNPDKNGVVLSVSPTGYQTPGTTVTITVGRYTAPSDEGGGDA